MTSAQAPEQLPTVTASQIEPPPVWATMQRHLMRTMEEAALVAAEKYARPSGLVYHVHDVDDAYESRSMRGRFYAIGASEKMLEISLKEWDAMTRFYDDGVKQPEGMPPNHMNRSCTTSGGTLPYRTIPTPFTWVKAASTSTTSVWPIRPTRR